MNTEIQEEQDQTLLARAGQCTRDPVFCEQLQRLIVEHDARKRLQELREAYAHRLLAAGKKDPCVARLLELGVRQNVTYSETQWVPDEFEALEKNALVRCQFGPRSSSGLCSQTLSLTEAGVALVERIRAG